MTTREKVIAAAKEVDPSIDETTVDFDDEFGMKKLERFADIFFKSGAASRDAEIQRLQMALADTEALELGTAKRCDRLRAEVTRLQEELENEQARGIHSCHPNCTRDGCVNRRLRAELAAALAACKAKDEALASEVTITTPSGKVTVPICVLSAAANEALAIQPDDAALKAWLGEPVAWADTYGNVIRNSTKEFSRNAMTNAFSVPLYSPKLLK
jgi:hypothetical protein